MKPETMQTILEYFSGSRWAIPSSKQHESAILSLIGYTDETIVLAVKQAKIGLGRTFISVAELALQCKMVERKAKHVGVRNEIVFSQTEVDQDRDAAFKRILNLSKDEIRAAVKHGREIGALTNDPIDPDVFKWRAWQIGCVAAIAEKLE
jgi:hypothetical protein